MKAVRIAELKSRLSEYLDDVRRGETIDVMNRDTLVAQIVPVREQASLRITKPARGMPPFNQVQIPKRRTPETGIDVVDLLLEERQNHR